MHSHERIDPRRGPKRERDDGRREIDAGVAEYEEDRDAQRASLYDSSDDWGFNWAEEMDDVEEGSWTDEEEDYSMADPRDGVDDAHISARVENNRIVIEVPIPAGTSPERWAKIVEDLTRRIAIKRTPHGHPIRDAAEMEQAECPYPPDSDIQNDSASTILETSTTELEDTGIIPARE
ncbi:hypothetical protein LCGC14_0734640 [marine sediment metagenome]|uniref:Uncharacterized protein n=1 Tax=marine sediment metagenome TaxID=412755 RepID=A0A0F9QTI7_9ZZZZ